MMLRPKRAWVQLWASRLVYTACYRCTLLSALVVVIVLFQSEPPRKFLGTKIHGGAVNSVDLRSPIFVARHTWALF